MNKTITISGLAAATSLFGALFLASTAAQASIGASLKNCDSTSWNKTRRCCERVVRNAGLEELQSGQSCSQAVFCSVGKKKYCIVRIKVRQPECNYAAAYYCRHEGGQNPRKDGPISVFKGGRGQNSTLD